MCSNTVCNNKQASINKKYSLPGGGGGGGGGGGAEGECSSWTLDWTMDWNIWTQF